MIPCPADPHRTAGLLPLPTLLALLHAFLAAGVDAPGLVPRNMFHRHGRVHVIDWEDADISDHPTAPASLTVMKWDIAWSDIYRHDPDIRHILSTRHTPEPPLDPFERAAAELLGTTPDHVRHQGIDLTLRSELHVPVTGIGPSAAELGHLADEVLPPRHSVLYTLLTAHIRDTTGDHGYRQFLDALWTDIRHHTETANNGTNQWLRSITIHADHTLTPRSTSPELVDLYREFTALRTESCWATAQHRAQVAEALLCRVCELVTTVLGHNDLQLLLRGSLSQHLLTSRSDLDFELSNPQHPHGHRGAEHLVIDILTAFGIEAEGSAGRPTEPDLVSPTGLTRDLHEWMELRRPGSPHHDPGWLRPLFNVLTDQLINTRSIYETTPRPTTAKLAWFEARALLARLAFQHGQPTPPATIEDQMTLIRTHLTAPLADQIHALLHRALTLRELDTLPDIHAITTHRTQIIQLRATTAVAGNR